MGYNELVPTREQADQISGLLDNIVHLARCGAEGRPKDAKLVARQLSARLKAWAPSASEELARIGATGNMARSARRPLPVDPDSRMSLARTYEPGLTEEPILRGDAFTQVQRIIAEHADAASLNKAGLSPIRTGLFIGPPGVGKTMAAHWIATKLNRPLIVLDLATSISSFLGKTGQNLRAVLDFGKEFDCVLMLDEVDAIAKRRSDDSDLGELKRLVNVLLQELDEWPEGALLLAATNHPDLLDPAIWRRFDTVVEFAAPTPEQRLEFIARLNPSESESLLRLSSQVTEGMNFADISNVLKRAKKSSVLGGITSTDALLSEFSRLVHNMPMSSRRDISKTLVEMGYSQRQVSEITGTSRNTIRKTVSVGANNG